MNDTPAEITVKLTIGLNMWDWVKDEAGRRNTTPSMIINDALAQYVQIKMVDWVTELEGMKRAVQK